MSLESLNEINSGVQNGEISGFAQWPMEGTCCVESVDLITKNGSQYFAFRLVGDRGKREFLVRIPNKSDKDSAKFMGMQKIYNTLYAFGSKVGEDIPQKAFERAKKVCAKYGKFNFVLAEYNSFSEKTGKTFKNQSLESLTSADEEFF